VLSSDLHSNFRRVRFSATCMCYSRYSVHDHPLYLFCHGLLVAVGETSYGVRVRLIGSTEGLHYLFMYLFVFEI